MLCGDQALVKSSGSHVLVKPAPCGCWSCEECGPNRKARLEMEVKAGRPDAHLVLTVRREPGASPTKARAKLGLAIHEFFRRIRKATGHRMAYFVVIEAHKSGWPHAHIAVRGWQYVRHAKLIKRWREVTGDSDHVRIRRIPPTRQAKYLAKYLGKELHRFGTSKRYWRTKDWLPEGWGEMSEEQREQCAGWSFRAKHPEDVIFEYVRVGWFRHGTGRGEAVLTPPPWIWNNTTGPP
jgi:hypothetical protein